MADNFNFLKKVNNDLYEIIAEAEKLYRDEYFEQCMTQTRRFGEMMCKDILTQNNIQTGTFDEMLATLKDRMQGHAQEKEFIDDLYFLKKNGNASAHLGKVKKDGMTALECLKRAFEAAINYSVYSQDASKDILKLNYDVELLVTGKKSKPSLTQKYEKAKAASTPDAAPAERKKTKPDKKSINIPLFWKFILFLSAISLILIVAICLQIIL